jgi:spore germination protein KC
LSLALLLLIFSAGCWDKKEIEDLAFTGAFGVDRLDDGEVHVSALIIKPFALSGMGEGSTVSPEKVFWLAGSTGRTVLEALCNFASFTPRLLFCSHSRFLVFGEKSAREGIGDMLDFFERNREPRLTARLLVAKDVSAAEFLKTEFELDPLPAKGGMGVLQNVTKRLGTTVDININDFLILLEEEGIEPVTGCTEVIPKRPAPMEGELLREQIIQSAAINGAAAFKGDRLIGWLNPTETRGLQWIRGKVDNTTLIVENPADAPSLLGIEVMRASSKMTPSLSEGKPQLQIIVKLEGSLDDVQSYFNPKKDQSLIKKIEDRIAEAVETEIKMVLQRCQHELNSDIFGFGAAINRAFPQEWKKLRDRWETEFPQLDVSLDIEARLRLSGLISNSLKNTK